MNRTNRPELLPRAAAYIGRSQPAAVFRPSIFDRGPSGYYRLSGRWAGMGAGPGADAEGPRGSRGLSPALYPP